MDCFRIKHAKYKSLIDVYLSTSGINLYEHIYHLQHIQVYLNNKSEGTTYVVQRE